MDQLRSVLNQVGGDAKEMQQAMSLAFKQIVVGFIDVGKALGSFVAGAFKDTAAEIVSFAGRLTGLGTALEWAKVQFTAMTTESNKFTSALGRAGLSVIEFLGTKGIATLATGLGALVITLGLGAAALLQLSKEQTAVAQSNAQFGATFGASTEEVLAFNKELSTLGVTSSKSAELFSEIVKAGGITKDMFIDVSVAANEFEKYVGGKATDAVKQFSDAIKDPIKELTDFGIKSGYVSKEQIELVKNLLETGEGVKAQEATVAILKQGYKSMANEAKAGMSSLDLSLIEVSSSLSALWNNFKNSETTGKIFKTFWETIAVIGSEVWFTLKAVGIEIGGIGAQIAAVLRGDFAGAKTIGEQMTQDAESAAKAQKELVKRILEGANVSASVSAETRQQNSQELEALKRKKDLNEYLQKGDKDNLSRSEYQSKQVEEWNKKLGISVMTEKEILAVRQKAGQEWDKAHKQKKDPAESFYDSSIKTLVADLNSATGAQEKYTKAQVDFLNITANPKWKELTDSQKKDITLKAEQAIAAEKLVLAQKEELKVQLELQKVWDATVKARAAQDKIDFDLLDTTMALVQSGQAENEMLILQATLIGATDEVRKKSIKLKEIDIKYEKELAKIKAGTASDDAKKTAISDLAKWREQEEKNVNLIIANDAAEKLLAEYNRIRDGITDSIVTALFEGGKAGSKKLRDLIVAELRKPITMVVNALVNTLMNSVTGGVAGSAAGSAAGGMAAGALFGAGGLGGAMLGGAGWLTGATTLGGSLSAAGSLLTSGISGLLPGLGMLAGALGPLAIGLALFSSLDDSGTMHTGGAASYSKAKGGTTATAAQLAQGNALGLGLADIDYSESATSFAAQFVKSISEMLDDTAKVFGKTAGYEISTAFADDASKDGSWGSLVIKKNGQTLVDWKKDQVSQWAPREFADGEAGRKEYLIAVAKDVRTTLKAETPDWADTMLDALGDAPSIEGLAQTVLLINQTQLALETMGRASANFANLTDEATAALIAAAGGAAELVAALESYYTNFYTAEERRALETARLQGEFTRLNKTMPRTREEFRAMMEAAIAAGDTTLVAELLKLAPAFASVTDATVDATQAARDHAAALQATYDASKAATDEALRVAKEVINREKAKAVAALASAEAIRSSLQSVFDTLITNIRELYSEVTSTSAMQVSEARANIAEAISTGTVKDNKVLGQSITTIRNSFSASNYATKFEADRARLQFAADLAGLAGIIEPQLTAAEQQVELLKDQIKQFDDLLEHLDQQLAILRGTSTTTLSIDDTLTNLLAIAEEERAARNAVNANANTPAGGSGNFVIGGSAPGQANRPPPAASTLSSRGNTYYGSGGTAITNQPDVNRYDSVNAYINTLSWAPGDKDASAAALANAARQYGVGTRDLAIASGYSEADIEALLAGQNVPRFAAGGYHSGGLRLVGENGPELEVTGPSRIYNANQTANMLGGDSGAIQQELSMLRMESIATAQNTAKLARLVERLIVPTNSGDALQTKAVV